MQSLQKQYNLTPGQYAEEMSSVTVLPHLGSVFSELAGQLAKAMSAVYALNNKPLNRLKL